MSAALLTTKLHIPPLRPDLVPRPRLIAMLNSGLARKLMLVSAPAGFGKTTILCAWLAGRAEPAAWLSLDKGDNDPTRFWEHFIAALHTVCPGLGEAAYANLTTLQTPPTDSTLTALINKIAACPLPLLLVLDDYHVLRSQAVHDGLLFVLEHQPANFHLLVASRADPPWPLARLRASHEMLELREKDLRFSPIESTEFLNHSMRLGLSATDVEALKEHTEGWIAGLQMAALSLQDRPDARRFVADFTASNRFIFDYLIEEVLHKQTPEIQEFLLQTSILEQLCSSLCNTLLERKDGQDVLETLERANLFLAPLDNERRWYRYHHLFGDLLLSHLTSTHASQMPRLHLRASMWYEKNGMMYEAILHALEAADPERAARLVSENALAMVERGELLNLLVQLENLPDEVGPSRLWLQVAHAWAMAYAGQTGGIETLFEYARQKLADLKDSSEGQRILGHLTAIRAYIAWYKGEAKRAIELANQALDSLPASDRLMRGHVMTTLGLARQYNGDFSGALQAFQTAIETVRTADGAYGHVLVYTYSCLTFVQYLLGQLHEAATSCREILAHVKDEASIPVTGVLHGTLGMVLLEWNQLEEAQRHAGQGLALAEKWKQADELHYGYTCLADVLLATGDLENASICNRKAKLLASQVSPWYEEISLYQEIRLDLRRGNLKAVEKWIHFDTGALLTNADTSIQKIMVAVLVAHKKGDNVLPEIKKLLEKFRNGPRVYLNIKLLCLQALDLQAAGKSEAAMVSFSRALKLGEPEGFVRSIIDGGSGIIELLHRAISRGISVGYGRQLLAEIGKGEQPMEEKPAMRLVEALSERELEVLRLLETTMDSNEIASQLYIAVSTVRTHIKKIYAKLGVSRRMEAIQRARELSLI